MGKRLDASGKAATSNKNTLCSCYDSPLRWRVNSDSRRHISYIVDLYHWECQCEDWTCRHKSLFIETGDRQHRCKHIDQALDAFWKQICLPRVNQVPVLRRFSKKWMILNRHNLTLAFLDELKANTNDE